ncbi:MAG: DUF1566 domain-containing protein [Desulfamplus sp.]
MRYREKTESYRKRSRLYGINVFMAVSLFVCISLFSVSDVFAELGSYDISQYGAISYIPSPATNNEYENNNFWSHEYVDYNYDGKKDTHTGMDLNMGSAGYSQNKVRSYGFGYVNFPGNKYNVVTIRNLLNCGEAVYFNLLHSVNINNLISNGKFISKYQIIGDEGYAGLSTISYHLHVEATNFNDGNGANYANSSTAYPRKNADPKRISKFYLDSLLAHYDSTKPSYHYYIPTDVVQYKELLPYLSTSQNPSTSSYSVFGYSNQQLYSSLTLNRIQSEKTFKAIGILSKGGADRQNPSDLSSINKKWIAKSWTTASFGDATPISIPVGENNVDFDTNSQTYTAGDYQFMAFISGTDGVSATGYPIVFSILEKTQDVIVDNDQPEDTGYKDACNATENTVPGYYLSAKLPNGQSGVWANWKPNVSGKYNIYVYVPEGIEPQEVVYKIFPKGRGADNSNIPILSMALNTLSAENRWVLLKSENNESEFTLTKEGYVSLTLSNQAPEATSGYTNSRYDRTNYNISANTEVFLDAIKFVSTDGTTGETNTNTAWWLQAHSKTEKKLIEKGYLNNTYKNNTYQGFCSAKYYSFPIETQKTRESTPRTTTETTTILAEPSLPANRAETLLLAMLVNGNTFEQNLPSHYSDVPTTYELYDVIETATKLGIVEGYDGVNEGIFAPENTVTRAEALKIIFKTFNLDLLENSDQGPRGRVWSDSLFYDLDSTHWSYKYAKAAYLYEIMDGFGDGRFTPNANITRSQLVKIVHQAMQLSNSSFKTAGHFIEPEEEDYSSSNNYPSGRVTVTKQSNGNYKLKAECSDPDGHKLSYYWIAQSGSFANISQDDTEVEWIPSAGGTVAPIELWVTDGYGLMTQIEIETGATPASFPNPVPDTGVTKCYNNTGEEIPCPKEGEDFYGQDGNYSINPMSYTKLDDNGNDLPITATDWAMVRDNVTGLIWENKNSMDYVQDYTNPHDADNTYTWYDSNPATNGGDAGTPGGGTDTEDFIKALNDSNFGGHSDWRLPTMYELSTIVDFSIPYHVPTIDTNYFKDTIYLYWSSTTKSYDTYDAWGVDFGYGYGSHYIKYYGHSVRAVRGGQSIIGSFDNLVINGNGTVTDSATGLMWQQDTSDNYMTWEEALSYCKNLNLGGYSDWRLPTIRELKTIVDYSRYYPAIDINIFNNTFVSFYWSSTTNSYSTYDAWGVYFSSGSYSYSNKHGYYYVRAVRGGQSVVGSLDNLVISVTPPSRTVDNSAGSITFDVSNTGEGTMAWSAAVTSGNDWLSIKSGASGSNLGTITAEYADNTTTSNRTGTITITAAGATNSPKTVTVTQVAGVKETITITPSSPDATVSADSGLVQLFGASESSNITIEAGGTAKLINFPGSNTIIINSSSSLFTVSRSGAMVRFEGSDGTLVKIPATKTPQTINFEDSSYTLVISSNKVMLDSQEVTRTASAIMP